MIPSIVASEVEKGIKDFIKEEFPVATPYFINDEGHSIVDEFMNRKDEHGNSTSIVKGPWAEIRLPFRNANCNDLPFSYLKFVPSVVANTPYLHQIEAYKRLDYKNPKSTIIATGTGSGKTECFLYPILEYCLQNSDKKGIKALIIYPMNALASDQSRRLAELIYDIEKYTGKKITAGIYTGDNATPQNGMSRDNIISDHHVLRQAPPDILLTNYKMLDFLLLRPEDQALWEGNGPEICKYLVVDELHSFDGAQGTDLSCLIRRLKDRLGLGARLACVGTSATMGGEESLDELCEYASSIFSTNFSLEDNSIITEKRLTPDEYLDSFGDYVPKGSWPTQNISQADKSSMAAYIKDITTSNWFPNDDFGFSSEGELSPEACYKLGNALPNLAGFRRLIKDVQGVFSVDFLAEDWYEKNIGDLKSLFSQKDEGKKIARDLIESLLALISVARIKNNGSSIVRPFLNVRCQVWLRSLVNVVASVEKHPHLYLAADRRNITDPLCLPLVSCNSCDQNMWGAVIKGELRAADARVSADLKEFYDKWFKSEPDAYLLIPIKDRHEFDRLNTLHKGEIFVVCPHCKKLQPLDNADAIERYFSENLSCPSCHSTDFVAVYIPTMLRYEKDENSKRAKRDELCPHCGYRNTLRIMGSRSTSLSAIATDILNGSKFNDDHKVIAFNDSVQDAALRAGFIAARNYKGITKRAIASFLKDKISTPNKPYLLLSALRDFTDYWKVHFESKYANEDEKKYLAKADFVSTFIPPDLQWWRTWKHFTNISLEGKESVLKHLSSDLKDDFNDLYESVRVRLLFEFLMEISLDSLKVHSLLNHKIAGLNYSLQNIHKAIVELIPKIKEEFAIEVKEPQLVPFVLGILQKLKNNGAIDPTVLKQTTYKAGKIESCMGGYFRHGNIWGSYQHKSSIFPSYGKKKIPPVGLSLTNIRCHKEDFCEFISGSNSKKTWYENWFKKFFGGDYSSIVLDFYQLVLETLKAHHLLSTLKRDNGNDVWLLSPDHISITSDVKSLKCNHCGRKYHFSGPVSEFLRDAPCFTENCDGRLQLLFNYGDNAVQSAYESEPCRVNSSEHTALIDGDTRKAIEKSFGKDNHSWSVNFLSATPTLEMGIDIGALSTVMLCNVPPSQASFVQRIGRAGRRDGNSLGITMVERSTHDQYYWSEPEEMIQGSVKTPGVFLKAVSVLERQLFAYALGRWVNESKENKIPKYLSTVLNNQKNPEKAKDLFPTAFIEWLMQNSDSVYRSFVELIDPKDSEHTFLDTEKRDYLHNYIFGTNKDLSSIRKSLAAKLIELFESTRKIKESWDKNKLDLNKRIKALENKPKDDAVASEIENLQQELKALKALSDSSYTRKNIFKWLTEKGLLPNYAFPEESVNVDSVVIRRKEILDNETTSSESKKEDNVSKFSFSRSAAQALRALSPNSIFYANGYKLHIDRVLLHKDNNGKNKSTFFEEWRLCPDCSYIEKVDRTKPVADNCPHCGCSTWGDVGQIKNLIRIRELIAHSDSRRDQIKDDSDSREQSFQQTALFINALPEDITNAWKIDDDKFSFGFEFLRNVCIKEINFGSSSDIGIAIKVAGNEVAAPGFKICKYCGAVYKKHIQKNEHQHAFGCKYYDLEKKEQEQNNNRVQPWLNGLFLYREVNSEAIRIKLPVSTKTDLENATVTTQSLIAALYLGLEKHFKGNVSHLKICIQTDPNKDIAEERNTYLVIYDIIPGGSGYLKDLTRVDEHGHQYENMILLFEETLEALSTCACKDDPNKDGCYHCVFHYGDNYNRQYISRKCAERLINKIVHLSRNKLVKIEDLYHMPSGIESVLEDRFLRRLENLRGCKLSYSPTSRTANSYLLEIPLADDVSSILSKEFNRKFGNVFLWRIDLQLEFNGTYSSKPDMTITPELTSLLVKRPDLKMCVFTDGWEYHANILSEDTAKRQSILNTGAKVWSLSWQDVTSDKSQLDLSNLNQYGYTQELISHKGRSQADKLIKQIVPASYDPSVVEAILNENMNGFDLLELWLRDPIGSADKLRYVTKYIALTANPSKLQQVKSVVPNFLTTNITNEREFFWFLSENKDPSFKIAYRMQPQAPFEMNTSLLIDDKLFANPECKFNNGLKTQWTKFIQFSNILQFSDHFWWVTLENQHDDSCYNFEVVSSSVDKSDSLHEDNNGWESIQNDLNNDQEYFENLTPVVSELMEAKVYPPDEIIDGCGKVISQGTGLVWKLSGVEVYLFMHDDLIISDTEFKSLVESKADEGIIILSDNISGWKESLYKALGVVNG